MGFEIRGARDDDAWDLVGLVAGCWSEYPGCILDVHGEVPELLAIASAYQGMGGRFWVAESGGRLVGSVGLAPGPSASSALLQKLYVAPAARRLGLGSRLVRMVEAEAASRSAAEVELWSDSRFTDAHRFYPSQGYVRNGARRELKDLSNSVELHYHRELGHA